MQRRATSKKRAAEAEKEMDMGDKEATPVEDPEVLVVQVEHKQQETPAEQPEVTTQTGEANVPNKEVEKSTTTEESKMDKIMEMFLQLSKKMDSTKEDLRENNHCLLYTSRCV